MPSPLRLRVPLAAVAALCMNPAASARIEDDRETRALEARIAHLEAQVASLEDPEHVTLSQERAEAVRALVRDVLADADARWTFLAQGSTAGWDNGFFLASSDGTFRLNVTGVVQVRYVMSIQDDDAALDGDTTRGGFENRRTALRFGGHVADPNWQYFVQGLFGNAGGTMFLLDAFLTRRLGNGWSIRAGKFRLPFMREQIVNYTDQVPVERSLISSTYGLGRSQGVQIAYEGDHVRLAAAYSDDIDGIAGVTAPALAFDTEYAFTARAEVKAAGEWSRFSDLTSWTGGDVALLFGGAIHWQDGEYGTAAIETEIFQWTLDASLELDGVSAFAAVVGNHTSTPGATDLDQIGLVLQGGVFLDEDWEVFGRYEWSDDDTPADDLSVITLGVNRYFSRQRMKWSSDVGYGFNGVSPLFASPGAGWRADADGEDGQIVIRSQIQLLF